MKKEVDMEKKMEDIRKRERGLKRDKRKYLIK